MLRSRCQQIWKTQQWPQDWKKVSFHHNPKEQQSQRIALISHASKVLLKFFKLGFNSTWTKNFQMYKLDLEKAEEPEIKMSISVGSQRKQRNFRKNIYFCFIDYAKTFDCVDHNKLWKILKDMGIPDHLICLLRNLYARQEATVRTRYGTMDWFKIGKGVWQDCILSPCLFNSYTEHIMPNAGLDESHAGMKTVGRNIKNLRYIDDNNLMTESEEGLKISWWGWKRRAEKLA